MVTVELTLFERKIATLHSCPCPDAPKQMRDLISQFVMTAEDIKPHILLVVKIWQDNKSYSPEKTVKTEQKATKTKLCSPSATDMFLFPSSQLSYKTIKPLSGQKLLLMVHLKPLEVSKIYLHIYGTTAPNYYWGLH